VLLGSQPRDGGGSEQPGFVDIDDHGIRLAKLAAMIKGFGVDFLASAGRAPAPGRDQSIPSARWCPWS
jgi:hypothetical protein